MVALNLLLFTWRSIRMLHDFYGIVTGRVWESINLFAGPPAPKASRLIVGEAREPLSVEWSVQITILFLRYANELFSGNVYLSILFGIRIINLLCKQVLILPRGFLEVTKHKRICYKRIHTMNGILLIHTVFLNGIQFVNWQTSLRTLHLIKVWSLLLNKRTQWHLIELSTHRRIKLIYRYTIGLIIASHERITWLDHDDTLANAATIVHILQIACLRTPAPALVLCELLEEFWEGRVLGLRRGRAMGLGRGRGGGWGGWELGE